MKNIFDEMDTKILGYAVDKSCEVFDLTLEEAINYMFAEDMENMDTQEAFEDFIMWSYFKIKNA